jgi:Putative peptidoglycan binding domain
MKKLISLLIGCSLVLAGAALAQRPVEQESPAKSKRAPEKARAPQAQQPKERPAKPQAPAAKQPGAMKEPGATKERAATKEPDAGKARKAPERQEPATAPAKERDVSREAEGAPKPGAKQQAEQRKKEQAEQRKKEQAEQRKKEVKEPAAGAKAPPAPPAPASPAGQQVKGAGAKAKKPDPQKVQQIKTQHANFRAQPKPQQVPPVTFNQNRRIERSEQWQGQQYEVFRSYRPEWRDAGWYHSHYPNVTLIAGGYYFFNNGYWFPAWGYNPSAQYYAYDGPIYVGHRAEPPDKVIADVQAVLQEMGYYRGEVDGLLGPLTREALAAYQADNGLTTTAAIDQPTLDSLGMG